MTVASPRFENLSPTALSAMLAGDERPPYIAPLIDQLAGGVGENALCRIDAFESDVPERAVRRTLALGSPTGWSAWKRPVRLLRRPERQIGRASCRERVCQYV